MIFSFNIMHMALMFNFILLLGTFDILLSYYKLHTILALTYTIVICYNSIDQSHWLICIFSGVYRMLRKDITCMLILIASFTNMWGAYRIRHRIIHQLILHPFLYPVPWSIIFPMHTYLGWYRTSGQVTWMDTKSN